MHVRTTHTIASAAPRIPTYLRSVYCFHLKCLMPDGAQLQLMQLYRTMALYTFSILCVCLQESEPAWQHVFRARVILRTEH